MMLLFRSYKVTIVLIILLSLSLLAMNKHTAQKTTVIRSAAALTTAYVATAVRQIDDYNQLVLLVMYTKGSSTEMRLKVEFSENKTDFYQETTANVTGTTVKHEIFYRWMDASGNYPIKIEILAKWYKVSAIAITSGTSTSCTITEVKGKV